MFRMFLCGLLIASVAAITTTAGCAKKTTTVQQEESIQESEPQMVSPGQEVIE